MAIKIYLRKAYDSVEWSFLERTLIDFGFLDKIRKLIMFCVSSSSLSIVWNGVRLENFSPNRGLRQGDPMSSYLFVLCMERLSMMISDKVNSGDWKPIRITRGGISISHLLFADNVLLFTEAKPSQMRIIMGVLQEFEELSGLRVSVEKSKVMVSKGVTRSTKEQILAVSSIPLTANLGKYLGFPLFHRRVNREDFNFLIDKLKANLSG